MKRLIEIIKESTKKLKCFAFLLCFLALSGCGEDTCPTINDYLAEGSGNNCLMCPLFKIIADAAASAATKSWNLFAKDLTSLVALATAIYIAIAVLKNIGSFSKQNMADFLTGNKKGVLILGFKAAVIVFLLRESDGESFLINDIITPILESGLEVGNTLALSQSVIPVSAGGSGFVHLFNLVYEAIKLFNDQLYLNIAIGEAMSCVATNGWLMEWSFLLLIYGIILFYFGWILLLGISFYIADILIRLAFGVILLPLGVAAAISPLTVGYSKNIWNVLINVFFNFVMLGITLGLAANMVNLGIGSAIDNPSDNARAMNAFVAHLQTRVDSNQVEILGDELWERGSILLTIICFCVIVQLSTQISKLANKISGSSGLGISAASKAGAPAAKAPIQAAKKTGGTLAGWAGTAGKGIGRTGARITRLDRLYTWSGNQVTRAQGFFTGSGAKGYNAFWRKPMRQQIGRSVSRLWHQITR